VSISTRHAVALLLAGIFLDGCSKSSGDAEIRILNASIDYSSLDLYLNNGTTNTREITAATYGTLTDYLGVGANSYTVEFTRNGVSSSLDSVDEKLSQGTHKTYVAYGNSGKFGLLEIAEDQTQPDSSYSKVELLDAAPDAGSVDVYLTDPSVALADSSPTFTGVSGGTIASAGFVTLASGTYRLRVTAAGSQTDIRLDSVTGITFSSLEILSIVVTRFVVLFSLFNVSRSARSRASALLLFDSLSLCGSALFLGSFLCSQLRWCQLIISRFPRPFNALPN